MREKGVRSWEKSQGRVEPFFMDPSDRPTLPNADVISKRQKKSAADVPCSCCGGCGGSGGAKAVLCELSAWPGW